MSGDTHFPDHFPATTPTTPTTLHILLIFTHFPDQTPATSPTTLHILLIFPLIVVDCVRVFRDSTHMDLCLFSLPFQLLLIFFPLCLFFTSPSFPVVPPLCFIFIFSTIFLS